MCMIKHTKYGWVRHVAHTVHRRKSHKILSANLNGRDNLEDLIKTGDNINMVLKLEILTGSSDTFLQTQ